MIHWFAQTRLIEIMDNKCEAQLLSKSPGKSAFQCSLDGNNIKFLNTESTISECNSLLVRCTIRTYKKEGPRKQLMPIKVNKTHFRVKSSSTSAFSNPKRKKRKMSKNESESIESSGNPKDAVVLAMSPGSCYCCPHKSGSVKPNPPQQWQTLCDTNPTSIQGSQNNATDHVRNESIFTYTPIGSTIKQHTPFVTHESRSIWSDSINDSSVSSTDTGDFFLDIPTKTREYYFDDISTGKRSCDGKSLSNSLFPSICDFHCSNSHQIQRSSCFAPALYLPSLNSPIRRQKRLKRISAKFHQ